MMLVGERKVMVGSTWTSANCWRQAKGLEEYGDHAAKFLVCEAVAGSTCAVEALGYRADFGAVVYQLGSPVSSETRHWLPRSRVGTAFIGVLNSHRPAGRRGDIKLNMPAHRPGIPDRRRRLIDEHGFESVGDRRGR